MLSEEEAAARAARELAHDAELLGAETVAGAGLESPNFWVFHPNSARALETGASEDSLSYRLPPIVVDRRSGAVSRPFPSGHRVSAEQLGPEEWFIPRPPSPDVPRHGLAPSPELADRLGLDAAAASGFLRLRRFRVHFGGAKGDGDELQAALEAHRPDEIESGLRAAGFTPLEHGRWAFDDGLGEHLGDGRVFPSFGGASTGLRLRVIGEADGPRSIEAPQIALARRIEHAIEGADWVRFWY